MKKLMSKKLTKAIVLAACALLLVAGTVMGTVAYLTSTESVSNTFTYGNVSITMSETTGRAHKLVPGQKNYKDTTIHVAAGSEKCYLFVKVPKVDNVSYTFASTETEGTEWILLNGTTDVYYYYTTVDASTAQVDVKVLESFTYSANATNPEASTSQEVEVTGYAVQAAGFATTELLDEAEAADAWNATFGKPADPQA